MYCCYASSVQELLPMNDWLRTMKENYLPLVGEVPSAEQVAAWEDCYLKSGSLFKVCSTYSCSIIFEYLMPREGGRRPDVLLLSGDKLIVLEYKIKERISRADVDQVSAYVRDLKCYHSMCHNLQVIPVLVPTRAEGKYKKFGNVHVCAPDRLRELISPWLSTNKCIGLKEWLKGEYLPLPSLVSAAKAIYIQEDLPYIRKANSAGIPDAVNMLIRMAQTAQHKNYRILALVTGVPGAGKTLLGLDFVHKTSRGANQSSVFLSGNGPLVEVLQDSLQSKSFVGSLRNYIKEYGIYKRSLPREHIVVFDEAQRSWDKAMVSDRHHVNKSEPDLIIEIAEKLPKWCFMLGLVGEGQEIHTGEESGIKQWADAIRNSQEKWLVVCPTKLAHMFSGLCKVACRDKLDLNISLRSHLSDDVSNLVACLLNENIDGAATLLKNIYEQGFNIYVTRELQRAKNYCINRYKGNPIKRYGLVCSSKADILPKFGVDNTYETTSQLKVGPWYNESPGHKDSCCKLDKVVTEFSSQGLELDMPIVCWGEDLLWKHGKWKSDPKRSKCKDPHQIRLNSYRVLLTRGRDGFIIYIPNDLIFDETYNLFVRMGVIEFKGYGE